MAAFLVNQHVLLQQHLTTRAQWVLQQAQSYEQVNTQKYLNSIVEEAIEQLDEALEGD